MKVCMIPARAGSKRIPNKNIRTFAGKPILAHAIQTACDSEIFDQVIVSTDSIDIATIAKEWGAEVPFMRPTELADDFTGTTPVIQHAIAALEAAGSKVDFMCCLYPTTPLLKAGHINAAWEILDVGRADLVFTATSFAYPVQRALRITESGGVEAAYPEHIHARSQDLEPLFHDAGQFYFASRHRFLHGPGVFHPESHPLVLPRQQVVDIDTEEDWQHAESLYQALKKV